MAPTTRAGSRRQLDKTISQHGPSQGRKTSKTAGKAARKVEQHFPFLELSPELRNRIYDYASEDHGIASEDNEPASEDFSFHDLAPRLFCSRSAVKPYKSRIWKFIALTQVCKLVRTEYRPLWMRQFSARLTIYQLGKFVETFLPNVSQLKHSPRLIQIMWEHGTDTLRSTDISPLLLLHAHRPQFRCEFIPYNIASRYSREDAICVFCMEMYRLHDLDMDPEDNMWEVCTCAPSELDDHEWEDFEYEQIDYTNVVRNFIHNTNNVWLDDIRKGKVTACCRFTRHGDQVTFKILYTEQVCDDTNNIKPGWELLKNWGLFDLPGLGKADFVLAYESTQKSKEGGYEVAHSVVREVRFTKAQPED